MSAPPVISHGHGFPCKQCGAHLEFNPGATRLKCPYCGFEQDIPQDTSGTVKLDFVAWLNRDVPVQAGIQVLSCTSCGASFQVPVTQAAGACPFCNGTVVIPPHSSGQIPPGSLLPFRVDAKAAREKFRLWVGSRFWAPNNLKKLAMLQGGLTGVYVPYWTYDCSTTTNYRGMMGIDRIRSETYTDSNGNRETREVVETDWFPAAGTVYVPFQDVLVVASDKLPPKYAQAMNTWQLGDLVTYRDEFLSGFQAVRYDTGLADGFEGAKNLMSGAIDNAIRMDIGGDRQQIHWKESTYEGILFRHVLLPIWSGAYRYASKSWSYLVNGQTGEVRGESPVSWFKVALAVILGAVVLYFLFTVLGHRSR